MDKEIAKTELLTNHFNHSLSELCSHLTETGDTEALADIRRLVETAVDGALRRCRPQTRLEQHVEIDDTTGRLVIGL